MALFGQASKTMVRSVTTINKTPVSIPIIISTLKTENIFSLNKSLVLFSVLCNEIDIPMSTMPQIVNPTPPTIRKNTIHFSFLSIVIKNETSFEETSLNKANGKHTYKVKLFIPDIKDLIILKFFI